MRILYPSHMYPPVDNRVMWSACWATHREINSDKDISWYWAELNQTNKHDLSGESGTQTHTALCFPTVSDCTSYTANEHEVHENTPKFGFSKSPYHLCFFFFFLFCNKHPHSATAAVAAAHRLTLLPPVACNSKVSTVFHLMNMLIVQSCANCVMFLKEQI